MNGKDLIEKENTPWTEVFKDSIAEDLRIINMPNQELINYLMGENK